MYTNKNGRDNRQEASLRHIFKQHAGRVSTKYCVGLDLDYIPPTILICILFLSSPY